MSQNVALSLGAALLAALVLACGSDRPDATDSQYAHLLTFDTARVRLTTARVTTTVVAELAETPEQHTMGLMERRTLAPDAGMLFLYASAQPDSSAFWMYRTRIPLDIAFIDSTGVIRTIQTMTPCPTALAAACPEYPAGARYVAALEVNAGFFARHGLRIGDRVLLQDTLTRPGTTRPPTPHTP